MTFAHRAFQSHRPWVTARLMSTRVLVDFKNCNIHRFGVQEPAFKNFSLTIKRDQRIVVVGPVSAGKTTLAEALGGKHLAQPAGSACWPLIDADESAYPSDHVHLVSFKEDSNMFSYSKHYYQERFNFSDPDNDLTLQQYLQTLHPDPAKVKAIADQLDLSRLLPLSFVKLSNGQTRRARLARALLRDPKLLILDEPLMGLDVDHRRKLLELLGDLTTRPEGVPVVLVLRPQDDIPAWATDIISLKDMQIDWHGTPEQYKIAREKKAAEEQASTLAEQPKRGQVMDAEREPVIELRHVNVVYSGTKILDNISWKVGRGERWALMGPNGSGKTTLLSFLTGDHPQAYANDLSLFGRRRGTGESIWQIKERVGLVSPEIHLYFNQTMSALEAAGTGFFDVVVPRQLSDDQVGVVKRLFDEFGITSSLHRKLQDMSTGEQRLVLLMRSLVKIPELIVWDEPFQGLDDTMINKVNGWLESHMRPDQTLIMVTHHEEEIPRAVTKLFRLGPGGVDAN